MSMNEYFKELENQVRVCYSIAENAREKGLDPMSKVEVPLATSLAEKAVNLISTIYPQLNDKKIVNRILELEKEYGHLDIAVSFKIAEEIAKERFCKFESLLQAIEAAIRVGFAYNTLAVVSSPIEGFTELKLGKTRNNEEYFIAYFSGPIRSAGTTAACVALMLIDYLREMFGFAKYDPTEQEVKRYITENYDYHERVTNLQYLPTEEEIEFLARNLPIQISGEPTEEREVSNYKDLPRIETNRIRGGMCLIFSEGLAQKAQKGFRLLKGVKEKGFKSNGWDFLNKYIEIHKKREKGTEDTTATYIKDLVAGRPVFSHPSRSGGFRFRYGKSRVNGFSATSIHPATMAICGSFLSTGTQLKLEKPTKGCVVTSCDEIDGPVVKLKNGSVRVLRDFEEAKEIYRDVGEILYLGDILFSLGDLINRNYELLKAGYVEEWWELELKRADCKEKINKYEISLEEAIAFSEKYKVPLHPKYIYFWTEISYEQFLSLLDWLSGAQLREGKLVFPYARTEKERFQQGKRALELLGIEQEVAIENIVLDKNNSKALLINLGLQEGNFSREIEEISKKLKQEFKELGILEIINKLSRYKIKDKAGTFIGARMGRPEKAKLRKLVGSPNVLFPVGQEGGRLRSVLEAINVGSVKADFPIYFCEKCQKETIYYICEICGEKTNKINYCYECQQKFVMEKCPQHNRAQTFMQKRIDIGHFFSAALKKLNLEKHEIPVLIKGVRGTSNEDHISENLAKGILRARYNLQVNKDGTIRYDATELPLTHFKPKEIGASIEKLKQLGYNKDVHNKEFENENQILELKPHDILLPCCPETKDERADDIFINITRFIDDLLVRFYGLKPFYNVRVREDLIGQLAVCMAPHNCAGVIVRIIGFSKVQGLFASPYLHAAVRRDCLGYDSYVAVEKEGNWKIEKIGSLIEGENLYEKADNFGSLKKEINNSFVWSNPGKQKIKEISKHEPRKMLKIRLEDGRSIEATESHKFYLKEKKEKRASELGMGDQLIVTYKREIDEKDIEEIFLPEIFKERDDVMIRNARDFLNKFEKLDKSENFYQRDSFPIKFIFQLLKKHGKRLEDLPVGAKLSIKRDDTEIPIRIRIDEEFLEAVGLYIAEGFARKKESAKDEKGFYQISVAGNNEIKRFIKKVFSSHFGLKQSYENKDQVTFSSRILYEFFTKYLRAGSRAGEKRIPQIFLNLKKEKIAALLRGYFEGDGSVSLRQKRVTCDSVSEGLRHDLSFVLSRFGIFTKFYEYEKEPGPEVKEFYLRKGRKVPKFKITKIIIPSDFVENFLEIGFLTERKNRILNKICKIKGSGMKIDFDEEYAYPKIVKIEEIEEKKSYCFNVENEHKFFGNDILVHNCDGDEVAIMLLLDTLINFSRKYLPAHRGGTQDAPLVLNAKIAAGEVDDQILDLELGKYPLELYEMAEQGRHSSQIKIETVRTRLKQEISPFKETEFTHDCSDFNLGVVNSSYKALPTMQEKVSKQMALVEIIRAVDTSDVARLIIDRHFIRDIKGNLRKFSQQVFRCVKCNEKFRRPPLDGKCIKCNGHIIFTISEGSIIKYLEPALSLAEKYDVPPYVKQNLELTKKYIESIFGRETEKQEALQKWF